MNNDVCLICDTPFAGQAFDIEYNYKLSSYICASIPACIQRAGIDQEEDLGKAYIKRVIRTCPLSEEDQEMIRTMFNEDPMLRRIGIKNEIETEVKENQS